MTTVKIPLPSSPPPKTAKSIRITSIKSKTPDPDNDFDWMNARMNELQKRNLWSVKKIHMDHYKVIRKKGMINGILIGLLIGLFVGLLIAGLL
tara:strand:- start:2455 stop:2733 length:279 start_codon:yes stop_codon:yes gene_type:complete